MAKKIAKQKADLRKQFEPVQLVENFCTDRDDEIRQKDAPERFFDWNVPFHGSSEGGDLTSEEEEEEAIWIMQKIPEIQSEYRAPFVDMVELEQREASILQSITRALRYMHQDKMEPAFIKRYRKDIVTSPAVRNNLYRIMDEDGEWDGLIQARTKVGDLLRSVTAKAEKIEAAGAKSAQFGEIDEEYTKAQAKLEKTATEEAQLKEEIEQIGSIDAKDDDDDDDDELFGDNDDDEVSWKRFRYSMSALKLRKKLSLIVSTNLFRLSLFLGNESKKGKESKSSKTPRNGPDFDGKSFRKGYGITK